MARDLTRQERLWLHEAEKLAKDGVASAYRLAKLLYQLSKQPAFQSGEYADRLAVLARKINFELSELLSMINNFPHEKEWHKAPTLSGLLRDSLAIDAKRTAQQNSKLKQQAIRRARCTDKERLAESAICAEQQVQRLEPAYRKVLKENVGLQLKAEEQEAVLAEQTQKLSERDAIIESLRKEKEQLLDEVESLRPLRAENQRLRDELANRDEAIRRLRRQLRAQTSKRALVAAH